MNKWINAQSVAFITRLPFVRTVLKSLDFSLSTKCTSMNKICIVSILYASIQRQEYIRLSAEGSNSTKMSKIEKHCESFWDTLRWLKNSTNQAKLLLSFFHFSAAPFCFRTYCFPHNVFPSSSRSLDLNERCLCNFKMIHYACRNTHTDT